ncbi:hypothetical protein [Streptomyces sp. NPDC051286]|uniref:hypothetical protein n=1 Tax=Streptomyces sp. NPDC051286 TaxID=3365647 RepID=UPI0037BA91AA
MTVTDAWNGPIGLHWADHPENAVAEAMASLSDPERVRKVLGAAGFEEIGIASVTATTCWGRDAADAVDFFVSRTPGLAVSDTTRASMTKTLQPYETGEGVLLRSGVWVVGARRPL